MRLGGKDNFSIKRTAACLLGILAAMLPPALFFYLLECYTHNPFAEVRPWAQCYNIVLFELTAGIFFCVTGSLRAAYRIEAAAAMLFGLANAYVVRFRTNPIVPWDIFSWRTAASVADNYDYTPDVRMAAVTLLFLAAIAAVQPIRVKLGRPAFVWRLLPGVMLVAALLSFSSILQQESFQNSHRLYNKLFTPVYMTNVDGIPVTFVMNLAYMSVERPTGYDRERTQEMIAAHEAAAENTSHAAGTEAQGGLPNIIVIMDEAFSDLSVLGGFETNQDYMQFLHSLQEGAPDTVTGMLNVSVCGGNTANTEFEFLTGNTMAFLPQGSVPYQQYLTGESRSLASHLRGLGYQTVATHPYNAAGWERNIVYPWLGFSESIFLEGYANAPRIRNYVSDMACVEKIIDLYEDKNEGEPLFAFCVTMQNHGGYQDRYSNFVPGIEVDGVDNGGLDQYLSLVQQSDLALMALVSYFSLTEEKTAVVFFGDHQPGDAVAAPVLAKNGMAWNALTEEERKLRYQVPYVIWANYDIAEEQGADTSANFLGAELLARLGVPLDGYQDFLLELKGQYPIISAVRTVRADGSEMQVPEDSVLMNVYRQMQYYLLFDKKEETGT